MSAAATLSSLCRAIDAHAWDELSAHLSPSFRCRYVHTGEEFDRASWVRLNAEYPGFDHLVVEELVDGGDLAVARCHVTAWTGESLVHFAVATFVRCDTSGIVEMTEVWTDANQAPPTRRSLAQLALCRCRSWRPAMPLVAWQSVRSAWHLA